jgi:hypothetical protein
MLKSLVYFHPEVTIEIANRELVLEGANYGGAYPHVALSLSEKYQTITHIDADVIIVDKLDELFDDTTDARGCRNNSDNNRSAMSKGLTPVPGISWEKFINVGVHSISSADFIRDWDELTKAHAREYPYGENDTYNIVFYSGKYNTNLLDPIDSNIYYGTSFIEGTRTYWDVWKNIVVVGNDHLELNGKRIKLLHIAGGGAHKPPIRQLVSQNVTNFIASIVGGENV